MSDHLGPYELRGELGRGAMAVVWRAFDPKLEREVAIKEPLIAPGADPRTAGELAARFVREGKAAAKLNHPGIVTIFAADIYDGRPAIVMEIIEGETLSDMLRRGAMPARSALAVLDQLLDAVGYAHAHGVVHRDIKPDNVFVTVEGRVKLADFGIAHVGTGAALTQAGTVMGTPGYMAPEQVTGSPVDARADLFAIGVIGYELLTGRNPFGSSEGVASTTVMYRIVHEPMPALSPDISAGLPTDLSALLARATAKDPNARPASAAEFRAALVGGALPAGGTYAAPLAAPSAGVGSGLPSWWPYAAVGAAGLLIVGGLLLFSGGVGPGNSLANVPTTPTTTTTTSTDSSTSGTTGSSASAVTLTDIYSRINEMDTRTSKLAKDFNKQASKGVSDSIMSRAESLLSDVQTAQQDLAAVSVSSSEQGVADAQSRLLGYLQTRAQALVDGCYASQAHGDYKDAVSPTHKAKIAFDKLLPKGRP